MDIKQIKQKMKLMDRLIIGITGLVGKIFGPKNSRLIFYFCEQDVRIYNVKWEKENVFLLRVGEINLPDNVYDSRTANFLNLDAGMALTRDFLKSGAKRKMSGNGIREFPSNGAGGIIIVPEESVFSKIVGIAKNLNYNEIEKAVKENLSLNEKESILRWRKVEPLSQNGMDHIDVLAESQDFKIAENFCKIIGRGFKTAPLLFLSEAEAIVDYLFPAGETEDSYLIIKADKKRTLFIIFAGAAVQFTSIEFIGTDDFKQNENSIEILTEKAKNIAEFYKNHIMHEHGASPVVSKIVLMGSRGAAELLADRLAFNLKMKIEEAPAAGDYIIDSPKGLQKMVFLGDWPPDKKIEAIPVLGAIKYLTNN